jgi:hypothetical protein
MDPFPSSGKERKTPTLLGPLERANLNHCKTQSKNQSQSQSQSYITTDSQLASPSWCQAPIWYPPPIFPPLSLISFRQLRVCWCGAPSLTRGRICNLQCNDASSMSSYIATDGLSARF